MSSASRSTLRYPPYRPPSHRSPRLHPNARAGVRGRARPPLHRRPQPLRNPRLRPSVRVGVRGRARPPLPQSPRQPPSAHAVVRGRARMPPHRSPRLHPSVRAVVRGRTHPPPHRNPPLPSVHGRARPPLHKKARQPPNALAVARAKTRQPPPRRSPRPRPSALAVVRVKTRPPRRDGSRKPHGKGGTSQKSVDWELRAGSCAMRWLRGSLSRRHGGAERWDTGLAAGGGHAVVTPRMQGRRLMLIKSVCLATPRGALRAQAVLSARTRPRFLPRDLARADEEADKASGTPRGGSGIRQWQ